jgi:hypothetical protein
MLTFTENEFTSNNYEQLSRWIITLSNGKRVIQDDEIPGATVHSAWLRLKHYLYNDEPAVNIQEIHYGFRNHIERIYNKDLHPCDGLFFSKTIYGGLGMTDTHYYRHGTVKHNTEAGGFLVSIQKWKLPEIILVEQEYRLIETETDTIILNNDYRYSL